MKNITPIEPMDDSDIEMDEYGDDVVGRNRLERLFAELKERYKTVIYKADNGKCVVAGYKMSRRWKDVQELFGPLVEKEEDKNIEVNYR